MDSRQKMKPQVEPNHYFKQSYDSKERFISYWHQINELIKFKSTSILEIGIGHSLVFNYLKQRGYNITSMDIDPRLNPNIVGSVVNMPFFDETFEVVACFELLEHLPYNQFFTALRELNRVSVKYAVLSIPDASWVYRFYIQVPTVGEFKELIQLPQLKAPKHEFDGQHYWEIGKAGYPLKKIINDIDKAEFNIERTYRVFETPYHRFFILKKIR
jgi:ubiquinone/menaquinone biosynthesis C-methylase UbiE